MRRFFFNAEPTEDVANHPTGFDREYDAADHADFMRQFASNGVFALENVNACKASYSGTTISVQPGALMAEGYLCLFEIGDSLSMAGMTSGYYNLTCRLNRGQNVRDFELVAIRGTTYPSPVRSGDIYDMVLARFYWNGSSVSSFTDQRMDASLCGNASLAAPAFYGTCSTGAGTTAKVANISPGGFMLQPGAMVAVKFTYANTATSPTLNVNGTGAKAFYNGITGGYVRAGDMANGMVCFCVYDGTRWQLMNPNTAPGAKKLIASFTTSGTFYPADYGVQNKSVDVYMVSGGGGGGRGADQASGGGGGYPALLSNIPMIESAYPIVVGAGGEGGKGSTPNGTGSTGGSTQAFGVTVPGGKGGGYSSSYPDGGSGGGPKGLQGGTLGSDGQSGQMNGKGFVSQNPGAVAYFINPYNGLIYCGGGGGSLGGLAGDSSAGAAAAGGTAVGENAPANRGGGGGAGAGADGGNGGSGVVLIYG